MSGNTGRTRWSRRAGPLSGMRALAGERRLRRLALVALFCCGAVTASRAADDLARTLYDAHQDSVYRVEVVTPGTDKKNSLGTGFVIGRDDLLASNFHVVSDAVHSPEVYRLEWQSVTGARGPLRVIAVDVIHDLALLRAEQPLGNPHRIGPLPGKGAALYAMGHPLGLALSIVPGHANGVLEKSLYDKIHFTGNINPGMSGGPALDAEGQVAGINVATAGEAVGFLVPSQYLGALLERATVRGFEPPADLNVEIGEQLLANQQALFTEFTSNEWPVQQLGNFAVPSEISSRIDCWGETDPATEKKPYLEIETTCSGRDEIYVSKRLSAGSVSYQFFWFASDTVTPRAFYRLYQQRHNSRFLSRADETDVGNFTCSVRFVAVSGQPFKANVCSRPYKLYPGLVDFMVLMAMAGHDREGMLFTLDLPSVTLDNGMRLLQVFLERFTWQTR